MGIKKFNPTTNGRRGMTGNTFEEVTVSSPYKPLTTKVKKSSGRNFSGRITIRHKGGGHAKRYRIVDFFMRDKMGIESTVKTIEYDPYRSAYISLVYYKDGEKRYVLAHSETKVGDKNIVNTKAELISGNRMEIGNIPVGLKIYNLELEVGKKASSIRSAGTFGLIISQEGEYTQVKMPSSEVRFVHKKCFASIGQVSNLDYSQIVIGKAGRSRWMGKRPTVRGKAMNPVDHPHGGGEGRAPIGMKAPKTPWGLKALGVKTRKRKKITNKWIVKTKKGKLLV